MSGHQAVKVPDDRIEEARKISDALRSEAERLHDTHITVSPTSAQMYADGFDALAAALHEAQARLEERERWWARKHEDEQRAAMRMVDRAQAENERLLACPFCGHEWSRHDPEDGECDAHTSELHRFGVCQCGRDLAWMQEKIAKLSTAELLAVSPPADEAKP